MGWKQAFDDAMKELQETRRQLERLDDPTIGLSALHGELAQSRLKIQELVQTGVTGLREENREVRRRQDRMISDLNETRGELRQLLDLADVLRPLALSRADGPEADGEPQEQLEALHQPPGHSAAPASRGPEPGPAAPKQYAEPNADQRGETMENASHQPQPTTGSDGKDQVLKNAIEAAYRGHGTGTPAQAHIPQENRPDDPRVTHGVLLLKAAGVASADLVAHRDTWEWLTALAVDHSHFRTPTAVEDIKEGRIQTVLSGRSLISLLIELWNTRSTSAPLEGDWALATTVYNRIATELADITGQGESIRIVLDDGLSPGTDD
ncbi:hypothetical protein [Actinacidiphila glaucinigra]|uniref:hypothetical protein n=1 Tax=Actinacidiphila glaucinigra TaxID=235986 RepID=UPI0035D6CE8B